MRPSRLTAAALVATSCVAFAVALPASAAALTAAQRTDAQISALQRIKASLTPAERKLDSRLVLAARQQGNSAATAALPSLHTGISSTKGATTEVDIAVTAVSAGLLTRLRRLGATVRYASVDESTVRAGLPVAALTTVAGWSDVRSVHAAVQFTTGREVPRKTAVPTKTQAAARVNTGLVKALASVRSGSAHPATSTQGSVVSEGDRAMAADTARHRTSISGIGVKVCVLSDGVDSLAAAQATGDLPASVDVLSGQAGEGDEGTAMLEVVHDLAPGAALGFATAFISEASFADNIRALRFAAHCSIIVDDIYYFDESPFQDGPVARAVNAVTSDGALYFSSAGNQGNTLNGTSGNYEGDFRDSGRHVAKFSGTAEDFDPGPGVQIYEPIPDDLSFDVPVTLNWADPLGHAGDDYDLYLLDAAGDVVSFSQDVQDGTQNPYELLFTPFGGYTGLRVAVVKYRGANRYFSLSALGSRFAAFGGLKAWVSPGAIRGHAAAALAFSVAAAPAAAAFPFALAPGDPGNPAGPYPNSYTSAQKPERFTSDGPRRVFFQADGTPITPGNTTSSGGSVRQVPDITASDGVSTTLDSSTGLNPFYGTSAAAPHAAAVAALVLSGNPGAGRALVASAFNHTALDLVPAGYDHRTGYGELLATSVLAYTGTTPQPVVNAGTPKVVVTKGNGDAYLEPGETASLTLPADNDGDGAATGVSVRLRSPDSRVSVTPASMSYGSVPAGGHVNKVFTVKVASSYPAGKPVSLAATVTFVGGFSPTTATVPLTIGRPASTVSRFAYSGPPVFIPDNDPTGASVSIPVSGLTYASGLTFSIDGRDCSTATGSGLDHTFVGDLTGTLTDPSGQSVVLFMHNGGSGDNLCQVVFSDSAADPFSTVVSGQAPFTGTWQPAESLATLQQYPVAGAWVFHVVDGSPADTGNIRAVSLHIRGFAQ